MALPATKWFFVLFLTQRQCDSDAFSFPTVVGLKEEDVALLLDNHSAEHSTSVSSCTHWSSHFLLWSLNLMFTMKISPHPTQNPHPPTCARHHVNPSPPPSPLCAPVSTPFHIFSSLPPPTFHYQDACSDKWPVLGLQGERALLHCCPRDLQLNYLAAPLSLLLTRVFPRHAYNRRFAIWVSHYGPRLLSSGWWEWNHSTRCRV